MGDNQEVIDVDEYDCHHKPEDALKRAYHKVKEENKALETKLANILHVNDALHRQLFEQNQEQRRLAQLLSFDNFHSMGVEAYTKVSGVSDGHSHINQPQKRVIRYTIDSGEEAQEVRADVGDQFTDDETLRLRKGRDFARREAERHAAEARTFRDELQRCRDELSVWKNEVNTRLPEMQALIQEQQAKMTTQSKHPAGIGNENMPGLRGEHDLNPLCNIANTLSSPVNKSSALLDSRKNAQYFKEKYELLEAKYNELLASKEEVSRRYFEDLKKWKDFKEWLVRDNRHNGNAKRRVLKRRNVMEGVSPQGGPLSSDSFSAIVEPVKNGRTESSDSAPLDLTARRCVSASVVPVQKPPSSPPPPSHLTLRVSPVPPQESLESLTQPSSIPPVSPPSTTIKISAQQSLLRECSVRHPSTPFSFVHEAMAASVHHDEDLQLSVEATNSSPPRMPTKREVSEGQHRERQLKKRGICTHNAFPKSQDVGTDDISHARSHHSSERENDHTGLPVSVTPQSIQSARFSDTYTHSTKYRSRRVSTILALDTPPHASAFDSHQSSSPDSGSPHVPRRHSSPSAARKSKRKPDDMEGDKDDNQENDLNPFVSGPSGSGKKSIIFQKREQKKAHLKVSSKKPNTAYLAEYMQYKGRGRYANAQVSGKVVNAEFEIDPTRNGGVKFQFDSVVRDKAGRKKLDGGDCECCRDYYDAIGPLPPRLQPPKWRSPRSQGELPLRPCRRLTMAPDDRGKYIELHKHEISRHRHNWKPPTTPPKYWDIGFPDTQEVNDINRQARDMHAHKLQRIEAEANSENGRYRRRL